MVSLNDFEKQILEMTSFYKSLPGRVNDKTDMFYAILARDSAEKIEELVVKYHNSPKNTYLHSLHGHVMTLARGVENFKDRAIDKEHDEFGKLQYQLLTFLEERVKW